MSDISLTLGPQFWGQIFSTLDVSTTALVSEALYYYLITSAGNPSALLVIRRSQQFYASRIYKSRTSRIGQLAGYVVSILSAVSIGFGLAALYELHASGLKFSSLVTPKYKASPLARAYHYILHIHWKGIGFELNLQLYIRVPFHFLMPKLHVNTLYIKKSTGVYVSVDKHVSIDPERITRNSMPTNPSLTTCGEEHGHSAIELSDFGKGASIA
ncbi:uncharacterized protein FOMMEDRAFT_30404 [Fomitiporia mediterranea MF3/22]|uniref:uncharacterized protein n=1 Tax=Fomitiporia mediterranea (strain MF3/22) TaxID=694068 RepID=UPI0004407534|nr:uncharacterized protein FOMMEDRAFT_30404 [Fomitiporia mediterranea MF3/22]EJD00322.1 hypothetical protein FOMMEDRAFT_30404 [Fomitiporia mediterranea MF3/22]